MAPKFQVALSYASEQRDYVERVAQALETAAVSFFFDRYETADMWGKDLAVHVDEVFRKDAYFVVFFVSKEYVAKTWPRREFQSALARAIVEKREYLLPVRFDDSELPGLVPTIAFVTADEHTPEQVADLICQKLGSATLPKAPATAAPIPPTRVPRLPKGTPPEFNPFAEADRFLAVLRTGLTERAEALRPSGLLPHASNRDGRFKLLVLRAGEVKFALEAWIGGGMGGDDTINFHHGWRENVTPGSMTAWGTVEWDIARGQAAIRLTTLGLASGGTPELLSSEELVEHVWDIVIEYLEASAR